MKPLLHLGMPALLLAQGVWETRAPVPVALTEVSGAVVRNRIHLVCGLTAAGATTAHFVYDPFVDTWSRAADLPVAGGADHCNVAAVDNKLYLLGAIRIGSNFTDGNTYLYDPAVDRWETVGRMSEPRGSSGVAVIGSRIYVAGGLQGNRVLAAFEVFDTVARRWTTLPPMPTPRDHLTAQALSGRFYALAGRQGSIAAFTPATEEFDPVTNAWQTRARIPTARGGLASGVIGGRIFVLGGEGPSGRPEQTYPQNEAFTPATNSWETFAPMPTPRHGFYGISLAGQIFAPGGGPRIGGTFSAVHEVFYAPPPGAPQLGAIANAASLAAAAAPGALITVFGIGLAAGERRATRDPAPLQMNAARVRLNGRDMPLLYTGPGQINAQIPYDAAPGRYRITVWNAGVESLEAEAELEVAETAPGIFTTNQGGTGQGAILISGTGALADRNRPARRGEFLEIYATGLGRVNRDLPLGAVTPAAALFETITAPEVTIGGVPAPVLFSGLAPGSLGLYQINVRVPNGAPAGDEVPVVIRMRGAASNTATVALRE